MKMGHNYFVYVVECADGTYYTGVTNDIDRRLDEHNSGNDTKSYTYKRRPVVLKYSEQFNDIIQAITHEKRLKGWSRKKKEALFKEDWDSIVRLSKRHTPQISSPTLREPQGDSPPILGNPQNAVSG